ncbi:EMSY-LIKE 1 protein [Nymphaea thermarum]|nr:EMSY-LIKE 1 protein [Nymphaea thermarum]
MIGCNFTEKVFSEFYLTRFFNENDLLSSFQSKEKLMSELRKELRVSDVEHRESLAIVDSDDLLRLIREWRTGGARSQELLPVTAGMVSSSTSLSRKKLKTAHLTTAASPNCLPWVQSTSGLPSGHLVISSSNYMLAHTQASPAAIPSVHKRDNKWIEDKPVNHGNTEGAVKPVGHHSQMPGKGRGALKVHFGKNYAPLPGGGVKKGTDKIEIRDTRIILNEVERVCGVASPDPVLVEKAKSILKEHEQSLLDAIEKLGSMSDFGVSLEQGYTQGERLRTHGSEGSDGDQPDKAHIKSADRRRKQ